MNALTRRDLDRFTCQTPGCTCADSQLVLHARCHPRSGTWAIYDSTDGTLTVTCATCNAPTARLQIAEAKTS